MNKAFAILTVLAIILVTYSSCADSDISDAMYLKIQKQIYSIKSDIDGESLTALRELVLTSIFVPHQEYVIKAGAIPVYISLLKSQSSTTKAIAAQALGILASNEDHQTLISNSGGIPPLILLLKGESDETTLAAIQAIGNLAQSDSIQIDLVKYGAIDSLVPLLSNHAYNMRKVAAGVLGNLAIHVPNCKAIAHSGAVPLLINILVQSGGNADNNELQTREVAVGALRNLAEDKYVLDEMATEETITALVEELKSGTSESKELAMDLLQLIATTSKQNMHAVLSLGIDFPDNKDEL